MAGETPKIPKPTKPRVTEVVFASPHAAADRDILPNKGAMDREAHQILRTDAFARHASSVQKDSVVGNNYQLNSKPVWRVLGKGFDEKFAEAFAEEVEAKFAVAANSDQNWFDVTGKNSFTEIIRLGVGLYLAGGEFLASAEWLNNSGRPFKSAIRVIEPSRLSNPSTPQMFGETRGGIHMDLNGKPLGYYIQDRERIGSIFHGAAALRYIKARKPWGRPQILHVFETWRPDQSRGVSEFVAALKEIKTTKKFRDIVLQNAVVNATYAASIESDLPTHEIFAALGAGDDVAETLSQVAVDYLENVSAYGENADTLKLNGVRIPHLYPGTKLNIHKAGQGGPLGTGFEESLLRYVAASLGISYEQLSKDFTKTNYSSARAALTETWRHMQSIKSHFANKIANFIYRLWLEEEIHRGGLTTLPTQARNPAWLYKPYIFDALANCYWIGGSRGQIDELKETQAAVLRMRHGLSTLEEEGRRFGKDWRELLAQQARERRERERLGLPIDIQDNTVNAISGSPREDKED